MAVNASEIRAKISSTQQPLLIPSGVQTWPMVSWSLQEWQEKIGVERELPFRCGSKLFTNMPQWESSCETKKMKLSQFLDVATADKKEDHWLYFDYKHMRDWFKSQPALMEMVDWGRLGFSERTGQDSTLWIGSSGAHTPCHVDTYGFNIVAQIHGQKQWILFPPDCDEQLQATRVPYEESSIYSKINFFSPIKDLRLSSARVVTLNPGDVLVVPNGWWHYVETISPVAISVNTWVPLETDNVRRVEESIVKFLVAAVCSFSEDQDSILNPNETDILQDKNVLNYVEWTSDLCTREEEERSDDAVEPPPRKKVCKENIVLCHELKVMSDEEFTKFSNSKRDKFGLNCDQLPEHEPADIGVKLINAMCSRNSLQQIVKNLLKPGPS